MLDLYADEEEVDLAYYDILQVISGKFYHYADGKQWERETHLDLLYSNSMCKQSSIPTSILIELLLSGGMR